MSEATPRQVLYAVVAGGFVFVVTVLVIGAAAAGIVPSWWSIAQGMMIIVAVAWMARNWRRTGPIVGVAVFLLVVWMVGTLILTD